MIRTEGLGKRFGTVEALRDVEFELPRGRLTVIVGPNASGKTTLVRSILGLVRPDAGRVLLEGRPISRDPAYRARIGYMPQHPAFPDNLTGRELLAFLDGLRGADAVREDGFLERIDGDGQLDMRLGSLSGGSRQKIGAAIALRYAPELLILDEPTAGLDPLARAVLKDRIGEARREGTTVVVTTHVLSELEGLAEHVLFLLEGRARFSGSTGALLLETGERSLERAVARLMAEPEGEAGRREEASSVALAGRAAVDSGCGCGRSSPGAQETRRCAGGSA